MATDREMPESWRRNLPGRSPEITAAIERARKVRGTLPARTAPPAATAPPASPGLVAAPAGSSALDELAQRRLARRAAEDARSRFRPTDPPGPQTA